MPTPAGQCHIGHVHRESVNLLMLLKPLEFKTSLSLVCLIIFEELADLIALSLQLIRVIPIGCQLVVGIFALLDNKTR
jgi:hypothetical protein